MPIDCYNARHISLGTTISYILSIFANIRVIVFMVNGCSCNKWNMKPICYYVYLFFPDHLVAAVFVLLVACCGIVSLLQSDSSVHLHYGIIILSCKCILHHIHARTHTHTHTHTHTRTHTHTHTHTHTPWTLDLGTHCHEGHVVPH